MSGTWSGSGGWIGPESDFAGRWSRHALSGSQNRNWPSRPPRPRSVVEAQRELAPRVRRGDCAIRSAEPGRRSHGAGDWSARRRDTSRMLFPSRPRLSESASPFMPHLITGVCWVPPALTRYRRDRQRPAAVTTSASRRARIVRYPHTAWYADLAVLDVAPMIPHGAWGHFHARCRAHRIGAKAPPPLRPLCRVPLSAMCRQGVQTGAGCPCPDARGRCARGCPGGVGCPGRCQARGGDVVERERAVSHV